MRKIALAAVAFALPFVAGANIHMASAHATQHSKDKPAHTIAQTAKAVEQLAAEPAAPAPDPGPVVVTVVSGDTLSGIADANSTTYMRLYDANDFINDPDLIYPGDQVRVPNGDEQLADRAVPVAEVQPVEQPADPAPTPVADEQPAPVTETAPAAAADPAPVQAAAPAATPAPAPVTYSAPAATSTVSASDAAAKAYIYAHESSNNPNATNYLGCYGLGQDCNGIVRNQCGADYDCQDRFFTNYAMNRYGSWQNALAFWQSHRWW